MIGLKVEFLDLKVAKGKVLKTDKMHTSSDGVEKIYLNYNHSLVVSRFFLVVRHPPMTAEQKTASKPVTVITHPPVTAEQAQSVHMPGYIIKREHISIEGIFQSQYCIVV